MFKKITKLGFAGLTLVAAGVAWSTPASAQATRTWVSGVGDDANPCSRTAPCKTFAGAISKTAAGGEINCMDSAGFGTVNITKSLAIVCDGVVGGVLVGGPITGISVSAGANDTVVLSGLEFQGVSGAVTGIRINAAGSVHIRNSTIRGINGTNGQAVTVAPAGPVKVTITNTHMSDNGAAGAGGGILVQPTGTGSARLSLRQVRIDNNPTALKLSTSGASGATIVAEATESHFWGGDLGIAIASPSGTGSASLMLVRSDVSSNTMYGISANGAGVAARVSETSITGNMQAVRAINGALMGSYGDNMIDGNASASSFNATIGKN